MNLIFGERKFFFVVWDGEVGGKIDYGYIFWLDKINNEYWEYKNCYLWWCWRLNDF